MSTKDTEQTGRSTTMNVPGLGEITTPSELRYQNRTKYTTEDVPVPDACPVPGCSSRGFNTFPELRGHFGSQADEAHRDYELTIDDYRTEGGDALLWGGSGRSISAPPTSSGRFHMACYCGQSGIDASFDGSLPLTSGDRLLVIFGSRGYTATERAVDRADEVLNYLTSTDLEFDAVLSGGADGADSVAEVVAVRLGLPMIVFNVGRPAERHTLRADMSDAPYVVETVSSYSGDSDDPRSGAGAYLYRNCLMADLASRFDGTGLAIWDGSSSGTRHMMESCESHDVPYEVLRFD